MSTNPISRITNHYRAQLAQKNEATTHKLTNAHSQTTRRVEPMLTRLYDQINTKREAGQEALLVWLHEPGRLDAIKQFVHTQVDNFATYARVVALQAQEWAGSLGQKVSRMLMRIVQPEHTPALPSVSPFTDFMQESLNALPQFREFGTDAAKDVANVLQLEVSLGAKVDDINAKIADVLDVPRWRSQLIAATELYKAFNDTLLHNYRSNAQVISGWIWNCRLSSRSCAACVALHGTIHKLTEVLIDHPQGQCFATPYVLGMSEIQSGVDWLEEQGELVKREILGTNVAYDLYKSGTPISAFAGVRHDHGYEPSVYQKSVRQLTGGK
jgi:Phage Mu protein F like protein